jgi:hypothetical protein
MRKLRYDIIDEDDLTGVLSGNIETELDGLIGELTWSSHIMRHRSGPAAEEKKFGADILIRVNFLARLPADAPSMPTIIELTARSFSE